MRQWTGSSLVQVMTFSLFDVKPLPEPMLIFCKLDLWEQVSVKFQSEYYHFHSRKCIWICHLPKWWPFCPGEDELRHRWVSVSNKIYAGVITYLCHGFTQIMSVLTKVSDIRTFCCLCQHLSYWCNVRPTLVPWCGIWPVSHCCGYYQATFSVM